MTQALSILQLQVGLTGMMTKGIGVKLHEVTVSLVLDVINLHHPQCF